MDCTGTGSCVAPACGDGNVDTGEDCDSSGVDTATCVGSTCKTSVCGDGHVNSAASETCDPGTVGLDTASCDSDCTAP